MIDSMLEELKKADSKLTSNLTPSSDNLPECVLGKTYFVTGSVAFGCQQCGSDVDICVPIHEKLDVKGVTEKSNYNNGYKFKENGILYNIIPLHPLEYCSWSRATKMAISIGLFKDLPKEKRVPMFQMLRSISTLSIEKHVNVENYLEYV